jgi:hypothetical protein
MVVMSLTAWKNIKKRKKREIKTEGQKAKILSLEKENRKLREENSV